MAGLVDKLLSAFIDTHRLNIDEFEMTLARVWPAAGPLMEGEVGQMFKSIDLYRDSGPIRLGKDIIYVEKAP